MVYGETRESIALLLFLQREFLDQKPCGGIAVMAPVCLPGPREGRPPWSLLLERWAFSGGGSQASLGEVKSPWLSPHTASVPATMTTLSKSPKSKDGDGWG